MKHDSRVTKLIFGALFAAMITVATILITIPTPTKGYINVGDCFVSIGSWLLGPAYGAVAAAIGSALADVITGYTVYIPATFVIKGLMAAVSGLIFAYMNKRTDGKSRLAPIVSAAAAELIMMTGYSIFEAVLYGSVKFALAGLAMYAVKSVVNLALAELLYVTIVKRLMNMLPKGIRSEHKA